MLRPLNDVVKMAMSDVRKSPIENLNFAFLSSPTFMEHLYRIVFFTESATSAEETVDSCRVEGYVINGIMQVGVFRRHVLKEELKQGNFKGRLTAVRCLGSYLDGVAVFDDPIPLQVPRRSISHDTSRHSCDRRN